MQDGVCYQQYSNTQLYVYPNLSCTEGSAIPSTTSTRREIWVWNEKTKEYQQSNYQTNVSVNNNTSSYAIAHVWRTPAWYETLSSDSLILPATLSVLLFAIMIWRMIMGLRR